MEFFLLVSASNGHSTETVVLGLTLPLSGWLADVYLGHYRVIRWSICIMWVGSVLAMANTVTVAKLLADGHNTSNFFENLSVVFLSY